LAFFNGTAGFATAFAAGISGLFLKSSARLTKQIKKRWSRKKVGNHLLRHSGEEAVSQYSSCHNLSGHAFRTSEARSGIQYY